MIISAVVQSAVSLSSCSLSQPMLCICKPGAVLHRRNIGQVLIAQVPHNPFLVMSVFAMLAFDCTGVALAGSVVVTLLGYKQE